VKLGLIGLGSFNMAQHAPALKHYAAEVHPLDFVLCEPSHERTIEWQRKFGTYPCFSDVDEIIAHGKLNAAYVTVPPAVICKVVCKFLEAGIPTFTEKPPGMTRKETECLIKAAGNTPHAVGFNRRFSPFLRKMKEITCGEEEFSPLFVRCTFTRVDRYDEDFTTTAIHGIDALRFLGGDIASLTAEVVLSKAEKSFRNILLTGRFSSGALVEITLFPVTGLAVERYSMIARGISVEADIPMPGLADCGRVCVYRNNQEKVCYTEDKMGLANAPDFVRFGFYDQARQFLDAVIHGGTCGTSFRESLQSVVIADFLRSGKKRKIIL